MTQQRNLIEVHGITVDERTDLVRLLQRYSQDEVKPDTKRLAIELATLGAALTWVLNHREDIKKSLEFAEELIVWVKKWRERRALAAATTLRLPPASQQPTAAQPQEPSIILALAGQGPKNITSATDEEIKNYFRQHVIMP